MLHRVALLLHLLGLVLFLGGAVAQTQFIKASAAKGLNDAVRDKYEELAAFCSKKIELPGLFLQIISGSLFVYLFPGYLKAPWLHIKLTFVAILLVLCHMEMINASKIVKARKAGKDDEIDARKKKHNTMGAIGTVCVLAIVGVVIFGR